MYPASHRRTAVLFAFSGIIITALGACSSTWESNELEAVEGYQNGAAYYMPMRSPAQAQGQTPAEALTAEPTYAGTPWYGTFTFGEGEDNVFVYALDEPEGGEARFFLDANNNEDLTDDGDGLWERYSERTNMTHFTVSVPYLIGGDLVEIPLSFFFYRFNGEDPTQRGVLYARNFARVGEVNLAGTSYRIGIVENDNDGLFNTTHAEADTMDPRLVSLTIDINGDGELETSSSSAEHFRLGEPFNIGGESYTVASISPTGDRITFRVSAEKVDPKPYIAAGYPAPDFSQEDCRGNMITLSEYLQDYEVVLLDFWATWCGPCLAELPNVLDAWEEFADQGLGILGVSLDLAPDPDDPQEWHKSAEQVRAFMDDRGMPWPTTYDGLYWNNAVSNLYRVSGIPATFLIDSEGMIRYVNARGERLAPAIREILEDR